MRYPSGQRTTYRADTEGVSKSDSAKPTHAGVSWANWLASILLTFFCEVEVGLLGRPGCGLGSPRFFTNESKFLMIVLGGTAASHTFLAWGAVIF
jgi:hypothetical protein